MDLIVGTVGLFINQKFDNVHTKKKKKDSRFNKNLWQLQWEARL
jgi:hypothetical protein